MYYNIINETSIDMLNNFTIFDFSISNYIINIFPPVNINISNDNINFILFNSTDKDIDNYKNYCEE